MGSQHCMHLVFLAFESGKDRNSEKLLISAIPASLEIKKT